MASPENMAATRLLRTVHMTVPAATRQPENQPSSGAYLSVRLWASGQGRDSLFGENAPPPASLTMDIIAASEGVLKESRGDVLVVGFPSIQPAIATARRLQWSLQGLSESVPMQNIALAALVQSAAEMEEGNSQHQLEQSSPGQILLSERAFQLYGNLPGLPMQPANSAGLCELLWRAPDEQTTPEFDERMFAHLLELQGLEYRPAELPQTPALDRSSEAPKKNRAESVASSFASFSEASKGNSKWLIGGIGLVAVILLVILVPRLFRSGEKKTPVSNSPEATISQPPTTATPSPAASTQNSSFNKPMTAAEKRKAEKAEKAAALAAAQAAQQPANQKNQPTLQTSMMVKQQSAPIRQETPARGKCDLDTSQIPSALTQAEKSLARGKYPAAIRQYSDVLACEPGNSAARDGLERAHRASEMDH